MSRLVLAAALCAPIAGLALTLDDAERIRDTVVEIRVPAADLAECRATLRDLRARPVVADDGTWIPEIFVENDLPRSVCVAEA